MNKLVFPIFLVAAASLTIVANRAFAEETTVCSAHGNERVITVAGDDQGCQVNYTKGGETKTLWHSLHMEYCNARATEFIEKQKGWGFECAPKTAAAPAAQ